MDARVSLRRTGSGSLVVGWGDVVRAERRERAVGRAVVPVGMSASVHGG